MPRLGLGLGLGSLIGKSLFAPTTPTQTTWDLGISVVGLNNDSNLFRIQLFGTDPNITVDWGDGSVETFTTTGNKDHLYASTGAKTVKLSNMSFAANGRIVLERINNSAQIQSTSVIPHIPNLTSFAGTFRAQSGVAAVVPLPAGLFANNPQVTSFANCFEGVTSAARNIPATLFANNPNVTTFFRCFGNASFGSANDVKIPAGLFTNNVSVTSFQECFADNYGLTTIPARLFANNVNVTTYQNCFRSCGSLSAIGEGLFANNVNATNFNGCFDLATNSAGQLNTIPENLFADCVQATNFTNCLRGNALTAIPAGLFANNVNATQFSGCFALTYFLSAIPAGLFANNIQARTFAACFSNIYASGDPDEDGAYALTDVPEGLFTNNVSVTSFNSCFNGCGSLTEVPASLFATNLSAATFSNCFRFVTLTTPSYSNLLINMASNAADRRSNVTFNGGNSRYNTAGATARATLAAKPWTFTDGGPE